MLAVILFVFGSMLFTLGALIDLIVIARAPRIVRAPAAPQLRGLTLGRWPQRPAGGGGGLGGALARVAAAGSGGTSKEKAMKKYQVMEDEDGLPSPIQRAREVPMPSPQQGPATPKSPLQEVELGTMPPAAAQSTPLPPPVVNESGGGGGGGGGGGLLVRGGSSKARRPSKEHQQAEESGSAGGSAAAAAGEESSTGNPNGHAAADANGGG